MKKRNETREKVAVRGMRERGSGRSLVLAEELWRSRDVNKLVKDDSERRKGRLTPRRRPLRIGVVVASTLTPRS